MDKTSDASSKSSMPARSTARVAAHYIGISVIIITAATVVPIANGQYVKWQNGSATVEIGDNASRLQEQALRLESDAKALSEREAKLEAALTDINSTNTRLVKQMEALNGGACVESEQAVQTATELSIQLDAIRQAPDLHAKTAVSEIESIQRNLQRISKSLRF